MHDPSAALGTRHSISTAHKLDLSYDQQESNVPLWEVHNDA